MTLWDRIERWRKAAEKDRTENAKMNARLNRGETVTINTIAGPYVDQREQCASELEADLRELRAVVERVPHIRWVAGHCGDMPACPRCALEARIGGAK